MGSGEVMMSYALQAFIVIIKLDIALLNIYLTFIPTLSLLFVVEEQVKFIPG